MSDMILLQQLDLVWEQLNKMGADHAAMVATVTGLQDQVRGLQERVQRLEEKAAA